MNLRQKKKYLKRQIEMLEPQVMNDNTLINECHSNFNNDVAPINSLYSFSEALEMTARECDLFDCRFELYKIESRKKRRKHLMCTSCLKKNSTVETKWDPYLEDVYGVREKITICESCCEQRINEI